jgi:hypothetical protein
MAAMATSADTSFRLIASSKKLLTRGQIAEAVGRAKASGSSLEAAVDELGFLSAEDFERIVSTRERHGRDCSSCGDVTFLLPKQKAHATLCEHCQGKLVLTPADRPRKPSPRQGPAKPGPAKPGPAKPGPAKPGPAKPAPKPARPTGRRIMSKAEREAAQAAEAAPALSAAQRATEAAAAASESAVGDITFSAPAEDIAALRGEAPAGPSDPLEAATPPAAAEDDDDLAFQSVAYDPAEIAKAREEAAAKDSEAPRADAVPRQGPPRATPASAAPGDEPSDDEDAPTMPPSRLVGQAKPEGKSAIGDPVKPQAGSPRDLRLQGGGFGYEPPSELAPRPARPGGPSPSAPAADAGDSTEPSDKSERARDLRQQGGGFGYEPPEELAGRPPRPGLGSAIGGAVAGVAGVSSPPSDQPSSNDEEDDRFAPPAEHMVPHGQEEEVYVPPLREDIQRILRLPLEKDGIGMLVLGTFMVSVSTMLPLTPFTLLPALAFMAYPITFLIDCTRYGSLGRNNLPNFPDFDQALIANLWRTILVWFACALPAILVVLLMIPVMAALNSSNKKAGPALPVFSIGESAYDARRPEADWFVPKGTDMSGTVFLEPGTDSEVSLGGEWTVIGLLNRSNADDTMSVVEFTDYGAPGAMGGAGIPGFQAHDLDRVGRAMAGKVTVYAAYADPDERIVGGRFPWLRPGGDSDEWEEEPDEDDPQAAREAAAKDALDKATKKMTFNRSKRSKDNGIYVSTPFEGLQVLKTSDWTFPGAFEGVKPLPVVYVLDAKGKVVKEYSAGVDDEQLYGDLENLMLGGSGGSSRKSLPPHIKPPTGFGFGSLAAGGGLVILFLIFVPLVLAGYFYWPAAQLIMVTFDSGQMAFNYPAAIRAIRAGFKDYLALVGIIVGLSFVGAVIGRLIQMLLFFAPGFIRGGLSSFISSVFYFYSQVVGAYAIGRYYYANKEAIGWFGGR